MATNFLLGCIVFPWIQAVRSGHTVARNFKPPHLVFVLENIFLYCFFDLSPIDWSVKIANWFAFGIK
jgi:hypothetical protein